MLNLLTEFLKYVFIVMIAVYTICAFRSASAKTERRKNKLALRQRIIMFLFHGLCFLLLYLRTMDVQMVVFYLAQLIFFVALPLLYKVIYPKTSKLLLNNMCMLLMIGSIMLARLSFPKAVRQFEIAVVSSIITLAIPYVFRKFHSLEDITWVYAVSGIVLLASVFIIGQVTYGAKLSFEIAGIGVQPSEFVKIIYVFYIASMLAKSKELYQIGLTSVFAGLHVIILVVCKDLGSAFVFFVAYLFMVFVATHRVMYFALVTFAGCVAAIVSYYLFSHVRVRVLAFLDPFSVIDREGYQVTQSLFAIGTGGWFGMGLYGGYPKLIPVVEEDFIFSAISEEFGILFSVCVVLLYLCCFVAFVQTALRTRNQFFCLVATGLACVFGFQTFLTIGGAVKFIPSTGVTLPLISYGGSSCFSTLIIFAIIQGIYISLREREEMERGGY